VSALTQAPPTGLRIGVLSDSPIDGISVDPACNEAVDSTLRTLESVGHHVVDTRLPLPPTEEVISAFTAIWNVGGAGIALADPGRVEPHNRALREAAQAIDSWSYTEGVKKTQHLSRCIVEGFLTNFDVLLSPTMACLPPPVGFWKAGSQVDPLMALRNSWPMGVFTSLFNVTGQPAISVPIHHDDATGLPVGVQLVAAPWREDLLLQVARTLESAQPWRDRRPAVI
jgi:amidase